MHTAEEVLTTNTARLAAKALVNSEIRIRGRLNAPLSTDGLRQEDRETLLLFPSPHAEELNDEFVAGLTRPVNLIVPDGSWRQAQKMVRRERLLSEIRHVKLPAGGPSLYKLRNQPEEQGLCTLEAIARSLGSLESRDVQAQLEALLTVMVQRTLWSRGALTPEQYASLNIPPEAFSNEPSRRFPGDEPWLRARG